ncbi:dystroglycan-type cadherin-like protein [Catenovulum agarivorans DS-2]|uniref:Dystroglycan-type cadherin-like protein n=1 Tax=Catenovulum agarivorans DS-2 TaxID=1328313 RepID=W7QR89_9ALTE|nr:VCBS domain-containing protein [Catenovulum agarivorans]EWH11517.1 dystroglycan-type cadherin-like protein [Catenovulum agarivorans DS-2]
MNMKKCLITAAMTLALAACELDKDSTGDSIAPPENLPGVILGPLTQEVRSDAGDLQGSLEVSDPDLGEKGFVEQVSMATTYGTFSIDFEGKWVYTVNTSDDTIANLVDENDTVDDVITVTSVDGQTAELVITISGLPQTPVILNNVAKISDTMSDDAGELRKKLSGSIITGKLTIRFNKDEIKTSGGTAKEAYIALYGGSTSTYDALVDLRIGNGDLAVRVPKSVDSSGKQAITPTFTIGEWNEVEISWDATNATDTVAPIVNVKINGQDSGLGDFSSFSDSLTDVMSGIATLILKVGDTSAVVDGSAYFDDIVIYSDASATTKAFEADFESYSDNFDLSNDSEYSSSTADAFVEQQSTSAPVVTTTKVAKISDTMSDDAGELRKKLDDKVLTGQLNIRFSKDEIKTSGGTAKEAYIALYGGSTSTYDALIDLRIGNGDLAVRVPKTVDSSGKQAITPTFTLGEWNDVQITWDATNASDTVAPTVNLKINGQDSGLGDFASFSDSFADVKDGVQTLILKVGDTSAVVDGAAYFDDIVIYSDAAATTKAFEADFEAYSVDYDLTTDSEYSSSSADAKVAEKAL